MKELDKFNEKYKDKEVNHCDLFWRMINFNPEEFTFCCSSTWGGYSIIARPEESVLSSFDKDSFVRATIQNIEESQDECKRGCYGCEMLYKKKFSSVAYEDIKIENIVWNHFRGCNSRCSYCGDGGKPVEVYYEPMPIVERLSKQGALAESVNISYGGGEPSIVPNIDQYITFGRQRGWKQLFNTNALCYREYIADALADGNFSIQVSVDAGTPETYRKIKGQNGYERVWDTIQKYCSTGGNVYIKYIVFSWNSAEQEIDRFIAKILSVGGVNVCISGESASGWGISNCEWEFGDREVKSCAYLMAKAFDNSLAIHLYRGNFSEKDCAKILQIFVSEYLRSRIKDHDVYIWGMGTYGKRLADALTENGLSVSAFADHACDKWGSEYQKIPCISLRDLLQKSAGKDTYVLIGAADYGKIKSELMQYSNLKVRVLNLL